MTSLVGVYTVCVLTHNPEYRDEGYIPWFIHDGAPTA